MKQTIPLLMLLLSATLTGCNNDSNEPTPEPPVQQRGYGEVELYDAARRPDGHIIQPGETAVLALEAVNSAASPDPGDTSSVGIDEVTFDVKAAGPLTLALTEADLAAIAKTELWTLAGGLLAQADRQTPSRTVSLTAGRYLLRVHAGHSNAKPVSLFVYPTVATSTPKTAQPLANPNQVQQLLQTNSCPQCDLSGANLNGAILDGATLNNANLTGANLTYAILNEANLIDAILTDAILAGANLTDAILAGANLTGANLTGANLSGATWTDGKTICAPNSIGQCK